MHANAIVKALIAAGLIDQVVELEVKAPSEYEFECERNALLEGKRQMAGAALKIAKTNLAKVMKAKGATPEAVTEAEAHVEKAQAKVDELAEHTDATSDAKYLPEAMRMANLALFGSILAAAGKEMPVNTAADDTLVIQETAEDAENNPEACHKPSDSGRERITPLSVEKAVEHHNIVWGRVLHTANIEGLSWLTGFDKRGIVKDAEGKPVLDAAGQKQVDIVKVTICRPFAAWLQHELDTTTSEDWEASLLVAKNAGWLDFKPTHVNVSEGRELFNAWLEEVPLNKKNLTSTRRERIVGAVGDRKWNNVIKAVVAGVRKDINKALTDWVMVAYSPVAHSHVALIKRSTAYRALVMQRDNEELQLAMEEEQLAADMVVQKTIRATIQLKQLETIELQDKLNEQMAEVSAKLAAKLAALTPVTPVAPALDTTPAAPEAKPNGTGGIKPSVPMTQGMRPIGIR